MKNGITFGTEESASAYKPTALLNFHAITKKTRTEKKADLCQSNQKQIMNNAQYDDI